MHRLKTIARLASIPILVLFVIAVSSCGQGKTKQTEAPSPSTSGTAAAASGADAPSPDTVKELGPRDAMAIANQWGTTEKRVTSHVTSQAVVFEFDSGKKSSIPMLDAKMVVAFAPYVSRTHPCENHYMSGCQGELVDIPIKVHGVASDGTVVVDDTYATMKNGFFELWLPRDMEITFTMEGLGKRAVGVISTAKNSNTCITTMQLL